TSPHSIFPYTTLFRSLSMAVVILAVHDVRAPRKQTNIRDALDSFGFGIDDHNGMGRRLGKIDFFVCCVRRGSFQLNIRSNFQARSEEHTSELQSRVDV